MFFRVRVAQLASLAFVAWTLTAFSVGPTERSQADLRISTAVVGTELLQQSHDLGVDSDLAEPGDLAESDSVGLDANDVLASSATDLLRLTLSGKRGFALRGDPLCEGIATVEEEPPEMAERSVSGQKCFIHGGRSGDFDRSPANPLALHQLRSQLLSFASGGGRTVAERHRFFPGQAG